MKSLGRTLIAGWLLLCLAPSPLWAITERQRIERLEMLADVWGKLYLFHPRIVERNLDWNKILVETISKIEKASGTDELVTVLNDSLFLPLDDPFTVAQRNENISPGPARKLMARQLSEGVGYLDATDPRQYGPDSANRIQELVRGLGPIETLIVDLRFAGPQAASLEWLSLFLESPQVAGGQVGRVHDGWNERGNGFYDQRWNVNPGSLIKPLPKTRALRIPTVFVVNNSSYYQTAGLLDLLQATRGSRIILERRGRLFRNASYMEDLEVFLPRSMLLSRSGYLGTRQDYVTREPIAEGELPALARELLEGKPSSASAPRSFVFEMNFPDRESFSDGPISREARLAGLFKVWTVISYMDLHVQYASVDWSTVLREWIPKVESAKSAPEDYSNC